MEYPKPYRPLEPEIHSPEPPMVYVDKEIVWEYKCIMRNLALGEPPSSADLNHLGQEGWELTTTIVHGDMVYFYFKRQR